MGIFHPDCSKCEAELNRLKNENAELIDIIKLQAEAILNLTKPKPNPVELILTFNNNLKNQKMALTLNPSQKVVGSLSLVDTVTGNPVVATFANVVVTSDNPASVTASLQADGTILATAVAPGTANITATADASYTDSNGASQTQTITATAVAIAVAQLTADTVALVLTFGTPS